MELAIPNKEGAHCWRAVNKVDRVAIKADFAHLHRGVCDASERCEEAHVLHPVTSGVARCLSPQDGTKSLCEPCFF